MRLTGGYNQLNVQASDLGPIEQKMRWEESYESYEAAGALSAQYQCQAGIVPPPGHRGQGCLLNIVAWFRLVTMGLRWSLSRLCHRRDVAARPSTDQVSVLLWHMDYAPCVLVTFWSE